MSTLNPVVAARLDNPPDAWAGVWLAEDVQALGQGIRDREWVDVGLAGIGTSLDGLAFLADPVSSLLQYGIAWLIEHIEVLSEALDWLAGEPASIIGHGRAWTAVAGRIRHTRDALEHQEIPQWVGPAADAYRLWLDQQRQALATLATGADVMCDIVHGAAALVGGVRILIRDAIAVVCSRAIVYAAEEFCSLGMASGAVLEQVATTIAACGAKISRWLRQLIVSISRLLPVIARLERIFVELERILGRYGARRPLPSDPPRPLAADDADRPSPLSPFELQRRHDLGVEPGGQFRPGEAETAVRIEDQLGVQLTRSPHPGIDWIDEHGRSYDAVGNFSADYFERQWPQLRVKIIEHLSKADLVPVDVSKFRPEQVAIVERFIQDNNLGQRVFMVGR